MKNNRNNPLNKADEELCNLLVEVARSTPEHLEAMRREKLVAQFRSRQQAETQSLFRPWVQTIALAALVLALGLHALMLQPPNTPTRHAQQKGDILATHEVSNTITATEGSYSNINPAVADPLGWDTWDELADSTTQSLSIVASTSAYTTQDTDNYDSYDFSDLGYILDLTDSLEIEYLKDQWETEI